MRNWRTLGTLTMLMLSVSLSGGQTSESAGGKSTSATSGKVEHITLPDYSTPSPQGPNVDVYRDNCLICHSARYVTTQPGFPRATWEKEVKKMVDAYGANISEADQSKIVDYLVAIKGVPAPNNGQDVH
jgi:sulfite dehydrogenase (cytochrome) subunit B